MDDLLTTLYDHYHVPFVDRRLGNIIERDHRKLIKELSNRQRKLVLEIIDCKDSYVEEAAIDGFKSGFRLAVRLMQELNIYDRTRPFPIDLGVDGFVILNYIVITRLRKLIEDAFTYITERPHQRFM